MEAGKVVHQRSVWQTSIPPSWTRYIITSRMRRYRGNACCLKITQRQFTYWHPHSGLADHIFPVTGVRCVYRKPQSSYISRDNPTRAFCLSSHLSNVCQTSTESNPLKYQLLSRINKDEYWKCIYPLQNQKWSVVRSVTKSTAVSSDKVRTKISVYNPLITVQYDSIDSCCPLTPK